MTFTAHSFCSTCHKQFEGPVASSAQESVEMMQFYHFQDTGHFFEDDPVPSEVKKLPIVFPARTPQSDGAIKPLKKKKADRYG